MKMVKIFIYRLLGEKRKNQNSIEKSAFKKNNSPHKKIYLIESNKLSKLECANISAAGAFKPDKPSIAKFRYKYSSSKKHHEG
ncbi:hypothetical protein [Pseudoalteromonas rubra]|uniref:Uncharacterized protein n=1 Tax=Pseudoalteromonas rubra TaxID=43658 RepID=A0A0F4QPQ4_9GAMM|nr:hypothetical protein [Pseudoalteromonas rubra]KJZ09668.1 hypothetical protein TW77_09240 [Pseudoalteromonas rubra]